MYIEGFLTDTKRSSDNGLNAFCRLEGMDSRYLASVMHKKSSRKTTADSKKKMTFRKLFGY